MTEQPTDWRKWYFHFGLELQKNGNQLIGTCPWCSKDDHYYIGASNGIGTCQRAATDLCTGNTNHYSFIQKLHQVSLEETTEQAYQQLSDNRNIKSSTFTHFKLAQSVLNDNWLIPSYNQKKKVVNLYQCLEINKTNKNTDEPEIGYDIRCSPYPLYHTLYGVETVKKKHTCIYLVEGLWDRMIWTEVFAHLKRSGNNLVRMGQPNWKSELLTENCIVAVPGSNVFKDQWFQFFKGKDLVIISDNDNAGEQMTKRVVEKLMSSNQQPKGISGMVWDGIECNDIRDMVTL